MFPGSDIISPSLHSKAARLLDGSEQLVVEFVVVLVGRNVDPIEAGEKTQRENLKNGSENVILVISESGQKKLNHSPEVC